MPRPTFAGLVLVFLAGSVASSDAAAQAQARCRDARSQVELRAERVGTSWRTEVVRCDGHVLVRRREDVGTGRGTRIFEADARGRALAWVEESVGRRTRVARLFLGDVRTGRVAERRVLTRRPVAAESSEPGVALVGRGVAWLAGGAVRVRFPGRPVRLVARGPGPLAVEDDRTLRLGVFALRWVDVQPGRSGERIGGCPARARWIPVLSTEQLVLTKRVYGSGDEGFEAEVGHVVTAFRLCERRSGRDPVIAQAGGHIAGTIERAVVAAGPWVVLYGYGYSYQESAGCRISVVRAGRIRPERMALVACPGGAAEGAVTAAGAPIVRLVPSDPNEPERVVTVTRAGAMVVLDSAAPGILSDLRADGELLRWRRGEEERSAPAG